MLNISQIKALKPRDKLYRVTDSHGLLLEVKPSGVKAWRYRYRFAGKAAMMALGNFPAVSLADARRLRDDARALLVEGINPKDKPAAEVVKVVPTFAEMYAEWYEHNLDGWSYEYAKDLDQRCRNHLLNQLGGVRVDAITAMDMLAVFKRIEQRGTLNMLKKVRGYASRVFRYAVGMGHCAFDPTRDLPADVFKKEKPQAYASTTNPAEIAGILRLIHDYHGFYSVAFALKMAPLVFLRPSELAGLKWCEVDFEAALITLPAERMKMKRPHLVPMARQVVQILQQVKALGVNSEFVFPAQSYAGRPINAETLRAGLRRMGITKEELTTHGFRHMASTLLHEKGWLSDAVERQLAHIENNKVKGVYNKAEHLETRREMMQAWADWLDGLG